MPAKKSTKAMDFIVAQLKRNPKVSYADVKDRAAKKRLTVYPIMYGRAKALLGLVPVAKRGSKKKKVAKRGPGRPRKTSGRAATPMTAVQDLVATVENHARENAEMRKTLIKIRDLIDRVV